MDTKDYIAHKAVIYYRYKDNFPELTKKQLALFRKEVNFAFDSLPKNLEVKYVKGQPYANLFELTHDIKWKNTLQVSTDHNESELLPGILNLSFRAVHDYLHYTLQQPFDARGEINVFKIQKKFHSVGISQQILFSEVVLQACFAEHYGSFPTKQKVVLYLGRI